MDRVSLADDDPARLGDPCALFLFVNFSHQAPKFRFVGFERRTLQRPVALLALPRNAADFCAPNAVAHSFASNSASGLNHAVGIC